MGYIAGNKAAWEEAFRNRHPNWGDDNHLRLRESLAFFNDDMKRTLREIDFNGKKVAQFCCNNGRELLSLMSLGASCGVGFDIAENIIAQARDTAIKAGIENCEFFANNILEIPANYHDEFDVILFTIGAITWFEDLNLLFEKAAKCLKRNGLLLINDFHPVLNMLPLPGEDGYSPGNRLCYSYFRTEPWIENGGQGYMSVAYVSKTFTSYSHTMSNIINALSNNGIKTIRLDEYDYDIGMTDVYNHKGIPLSYIWLRKSAEERRLTLMVTSVNSRSGLRCRTRGACSQALRSFACGEQ